MNTFQHDTIAALRREIHAHPELGFEEARTSDLVAAKLAQWGITTHLGMAKTAVIGVVQGRDGGAQDSAVFSCSPIQIPVHTPEFLCLH